MKCELPDSNPTNESMKELFERTKIIAIVGLSDRPERDSYMVAEYLQRNGYRIIPVNPGKDVILEEKCYPTLASVPEKIDIVNVFRRMEAVPGVVEEAIAVKPGAIWLQLGLAHKESAEKARTAGIGFIQSKCIKIVHHQLLH